MTIDLVAIVDTETQGLESAKHRVIEVGCTIYSVRYASVVEAWSAIIRDEENQAAKINHISAELLKTHGADREQTLATLKMMVQRTELWIAHRVEFDAAFLPDLGRRSVCSKFDMEFPLSKGGDALVNVALAHGVPVHDNHRALTDVMLIVRTFQRCAELGHDVSAIIERGLRPKAKFYAVEGRKGVPGNKYDPKKNELYKMYGFKWNDPDWVRTMAFEDAEFLPFEVKVLEEIK